MRAAVVHEAIRSEGEVELRRPVGALFWSGVGSGLSMGFSLIAMGLLFNHLPNAGWRRHYRMGHSYHSLCARGPHRVCRDGCAHDEGSMGDGDDAR
ncbi:MAG TPA: hypothetical protein VKV03_18955, partial [Candidatus Binataceae bacterium]|nr:hypothetical protein [Candidatus Binataceae bacterium]